VVRSSSYSGVAIGWAGWAKSRGPPSERAPEFQFQRQSYKEERVEWGRGPWRAVLAFLPRNPQVPSYATEQLMLEIQHVCILGHDIKLNVRIQLV